MDKQVNEMIREEKERAKKTHSPFFNSSHEGYAVILEEYEEVLDEVELVKFFVREFWDSVKKDDVTGQVPNILALRRYSMCAIKELVQLCAMCDKFEESFRRWENEQRGTDREINQRPRNEIHSSVGNSGGQFHFSGGQAIGERKDG